MTAEDPAAAVVWMVRGAWVTMVLRAACQLEVFDRLVEPTSAGAVARACGSDPHATTRLLRVLADVGLVEQRDGDVYANTALGETLLVDHPSRVRSLLLMQTWLPNLTAWSELAQGVRTGSSVFEAVNGSPMWELLGAHPEVESQFNEAMTRRASEQLEAVLAGVDLSGVRTIVDVGGGRGALLEGILHAAPTASGVVADRPEVAAEAEAAFAAAGWGQRARAVPADFFVEVPPGADLYLISNVLHDWSDDDCVRILRTVRAAMAAGSRVAVVERVLDVADRPFETARDVHLVDLHMLVTFGARERTLAEYAALLTAAGFVTTELTGGGPSWNVVEAR